MREQKGVNHVDVPKVTGNHNAAQQMTERYVA
jgi:hypothetical protein